MAWLVGNSPLCVVLEGDPLSLLIFVLVAELLQAAVNDALCDQMLKLLIENRSSVDYPVIQYADDTLLVMPACEIQAHTMKKFWLTTQIQWD